METAMLKETIHMPANGHILKDRTIFHFLSPVQLNPPCGPEDLVPTPFEFQDFVLRKVLTRLFASSLMAASKFMQCG